MKKKMLWSLIGATILILSACGQKSPIENPLNYEVQSFEYTNQDNDQVSLEDLKGTVWVADFIFTSCDTVCPPMTAHMTELQQILENEGAIQGSFPLVLIQKLILLINLKSLQSLTQFHLKTGIF